MILMLLLSLTVSKRTIYILFIIFFSLFYLRMSSKRKATPIIEEDDEYSESSNLEGVVAENDISVESGNEENLEEVIPLKKKKTQFYSVFLC